MAHPLPGPAAPPPLGPDGFDWTVWNADPILVAGLVLAGGLYVGALVRRRRRAPTPPVEAPRVIAFFAGLGVMFASLTGPLHDLSDYYLFSAHMVQHLLLAFAVPPLLLGGTPRWLADALLTSVPPALRRLARILTRPSGAFAAFNLVLVAWHLPPLYNLAMVQHPVHIVQHLMILVVSVLLWWPVLSPSRLLPRAPYPVQLLYLFVVGLPMVVVSIFITMAEAVLYPYYAAAPRVFAHLTPHADQHLGGLIMWIPGGMVFLVANAVVFYRWQGAGGDDVAIEAAEVG
ncbi:MAG TPA: cytochrome c oxidase assembly protein [Candidatus Limnocylindrales bacterium]|nr:cytochrome c oxidase assembly protein [Candidatus Limnocylindrales bacterium]